MNTNELWQATLGELELSISKPNFTTWFKNTFINNVCDGEVFVCVPNTFTKAWLEKKYHSSILKALQNITNYEVRRVTYKVETRRGPIGLPSETTPETSLSKQTPVVSKIPLSSQEQGNRNLNPKYLFSSFIVGKGNEFAYAAAQAVVQKPGLSYNPLFIYGGVGLGKTHLLQAIGHELLRQNPRTRVLYATSERFTNDFIGAVRSGRGREFKDTYRNVDLLLIDDIQFITGKEGTQEEFFHTFNTLHQANKQIVLSSDRHPRAIPAIDQRLLSRFQMGMTADISSPDFETRVAILEAKCKEKGFELEKELVGFVANAIQSNVRELEGALNKVIAFHQFKNLTPSAETIQSVVNSLGQGGARASLTPKNIINIVAQYYDLETEELLGKSRERRLAFPRQIIMFLMREELKSSFPAIGQEIGGRDHTTAMHAHLKIVKGLENDLKLQQDMDVLKQKLFIS